VSHRNDYKLSHAKHTLASQRNCLNNAAAKTGHVYTLSEG